MAVLFDRFGIAVPACFSSEQFTDRDGEVGKAYYRAVEQCIARLSGGTEGVAPEGRPLMLAGVRDEEVESKELCRRCARSTEDSVVFGSLDKEFRSGQPGAGLGGARLSVDLRHSCDIRGGGLLVPGEVVTPVSPCENSAVLDSKLRDFVESEGSEKTVEPPIGGSSVGPNWARNRKNREKKKENKKKGKLADDQVKSGPEHSSKSVPAWRVRGEVEARPAGSGFFSSCSQDVQTRLRESRANMLIAENKKKELEALARQKKLESVTPEIEAVMQLVNLTRMANQLKKQTKDQHIGGWAETVANQLTKSAVESAPSSLPSLESIEKGDSALKSEGVCVEFDAERELRLLEYNLKKTRLDRYYEAVDCYSPADQEHEYRMLDHEYSDVTRSDAQRQSQESADKIAASMQKYGVDQYKIQDILVGAGFEFYAA